MTTSRRIGFAWSRRLGRLGSSSLVLALGLCGVGCTNVDLEVPPDPPPAALDDKLVLEGEFCTRDPAEVLFPVKVLFVIDTSQSMNITDPECGRALAVQDVVERLLPGDETEGVEIAVVGFNGSTSILTQADVDGDGIPDKDGFTADKEALYVAINELCQSGATTDYEGALGVALQLLAGDMIESGRGELSRAKYVVIFHSDGLPNPVTPSHNTPGRIWGLVSSIMALPEQFPVRDIHFHSTYLSADTPRAVRNEATRLLRGMAERGDGTFRDFETGRATSFLQVDFTAIRRLFALKSLVVTNINAMPRDGAVEVDTDADGLTDREERPLGTDPLQADTDQDGFGDLLEHRLRTSGYDPLGLGDADCRIPPDYEVDRTDSDSDGLLDCEERFVGTNPSLMDSDADGFPDNLEYRFGANPSGNDTLDDPDFDGASNAVELRAHMDPRSADAHKMADLAYRTIVDPPVFAETRECFTWTVENITLVPTRERKLAGRDDTPIGINDIYVYINEVPFDDPEDVGFYSMACIRAQYLPHLELKRPASGRIRLDQALFVGPEEFDPALDCISVR